VDVKVGHRLAASLAVVDADVVAVRFVAFVQNGLGFIECSQQGGLFFRRGIEQSGEVASGNDDGMARRDGKPSL
jgi:hypothetical protein